MYRRPGDYNISRSSQGRHYYNTRNLNASASLNRHGNHHNPRSLQDSNHHNPGNVYTSPPINGQRVPSIPGVYFSPAGYQFGAPYGSFGIPHTSSTGSYWLAGPPVEYGYLGGAGPSNWSTGGGHYPRSSFTANNKVHMPWSHGHYEAVRSSQANPLTIYPASYFEAGPSQCVNFPVQYLDYGTIYPHTSGTLAAGISNGQVQDVAAALPPEFYAYTEPHTAPGLEQDAAAAVPPEFYAYTEPYTGQVQDVAAALPPEFYAPTEPYTGQVQDEAAALPPEFYAYREAYTGLQQDVAAAVPPEFYAYTEPYTGMMHTYPIQSTGEFPVAGPSFVPDQEMLQYVPHVDVPALSDSSTETVPDRDVHFLLREFGLTAAEEENLSMGNNGILHFHKKTKNVIHDFDEGYKWPDKKMRFVALKRRTAKNSPQELLIQTHTYFTCPKYFACVYKCSPRLWHKVDFDTYYDISSQVTCRNHEKEDDFCEECCKQWQKYINICQKWKKAKTSKKNKISRQKFKHPIIHPITNKLPEVTYEDGIPVVSLLGLFTPPESVYEPESVDTPLEFFSENNQSPSPQEPDPERNYDVDGDGWHYNG